MTNASSASVLTEEGMDVKAHAETYIMFKISNFYFNLHFPFHKKKSASKFLLINCFNKLNSTEI